MTERDWSDICKILTDIDWALRDPKSREKAMQRALRLARSRLAEAINQEA